MATRKIVADGWLYRTARHDSLGLVLVDPTDQDDLPEGTLRVFVLETHQTARFDRREFARSLSGDLSDDDCSGLLVPYRAFRRALGRPAAAPPEVAHASLFRYRGLPVPETRPRGPDNIPHGQSCRVCKRALDADLEIECTQCGAIVCRCGACGCETPDA